MNRQILEKPFDQNQIKQREGHFGKMLDYIEGHAVIQRLNDAFEADWSFTIIRHEILKETDEVIVLGELKAGNVVKMQFGSSRITRARESGDIISLADDLKAAATDAVKKASTLLGVGLHLYRNDVPQPGNRNGDNLPDKGHRNDGNDGNGSGHQRGSGNGNGNGSGGNRHGSSNGSGDNHNNGNGNGNGRLSSKQYNYALTLAKDRGITRSELNNQCLEAYGVVLEHLSKRDASSMIEGLKGE